MVAADKGYDGVAARLLEAGADFDPGERENRTALLIAAQHGHGAVISLLLKAGADPDHANGDGWTALMLATDKGYEGVAARLLEAGADPGQANNIGWTALMLAAEKGCDRVAAYLLETGADPNSVAADGQTSLMLAARHGRAPLMERLIAKGANVHVRGPQGRTPIHSAIDSGQEHAFRVLLNAGADVKSITDVGSTLLHCAIRANGGALVQAVLKSGIMIDAQDLNRRTALHLACEENYQEQLSEVIGALLACNADPTIEDNHGLTAFLVAALNHDLVGVKSFLKAGVPPSMTNSQGLGMLAAAAGVSEPGFLLVLLAEGATPNPTSPAAKPLIRAAQAGHIQNIRVLCEAGAAVDAADERELSSLMYASWFGHAQAVGVLLELGADPNRVGPGGWTPLMFAVNGGSMLESSDLNRTISGLLQAGAKIDARNDLGLSALEIAQVQGAVLVTKVPERSTPQTSSVAAPGPSAAQTRSSSVNPLEHYRSGQMPEHGLRVEILVNDKGECIIFHNKPFKSEIISTLYFHESNELSFRLAAEESNPIPIRLGLKRYLRNSTKILLVLMNDISGEPIEGTYIPIVHVMQGRGLKTNVHNEPSKGRYDLRFSMLNLQIYAITNCAQPEAISAEYNVLSNQILFYENSSVAAKIAIDEEWRPRIIKSLDVTVEYVCEQQGSFRVNTTRRCPLRFAFIATVAKTCGDGSSPKG